MTTRERRLGILFAVIFGVALTHYLVNTLAIAPIREMNRQIQSAEKSERELGAKLAAGLRARRTWKRLAGRTIGIENDEAQARVWLDREIWELVKAAGLESISVSPGSPRRVKKTQLLTLPCTVSAEGTLQAVTRFLYEFYTWPFNVKVTGLDISQRSPGRVRMEAKIEALILPAGPGLPDVQSAPLDPGLRPEPHRQLHEEGMAGYAVIAQRDIFTGREPRPEPPIVKPPVTVVRNEPREHLTPPAPPPPPGRLHTTVQALLSYPGQEEVITLNTQTQQREAHAIGERMDGDCKLAAIHPYGAIGLDADIYYLYPLSHTLAERERIEQATHPLLWSWLHAPKVKPPEHQPPGEAPWRGAADAELPADVTLDLWQLLENPPELAGNGNSAEWRIPRGTEYADLDRTSRATAP